MQEFLFGFGLIGTLSQRHSYPASAKMARKKPLSQEKLFDANASRFSDRSRKSGRKNAQKLWEEALSQQKEGWLTTHFPLSTENEPFVLKGPKINVSFRFGVEQGAKLRACDDLRHSVTNLACVVLTPIKLASWDHLAEISNILNTHSRGWSFFKADHEAAYKQLPLRESPSHLAVTALKCPSDGRRYGFSAAP